MTTTEALTEREQEALERMREAQKQGVTLKAYAAKMGLDVGQLYDLRRRLVRKGAFGALPPRKPRKSRKATAFVPVRVVPAGTVPSGTSPMCRLLHPGGWVLECDGLPPASWVAAVLTGGAHAAS
jgi:hypothetical protein